MDYSPLLTISLKHSFYSNGFCPDFSIRADSKTQSLLDKQRCIIKTEAFGLTIGMPVIEQQPQIPFADDVSLDFDLFLQNNDFSLFTDTRIQLSNTTGVQISQSGIQLVPEPGSTTLPVSTLPKVNQSLLNISYQRDFNQINTNIASDEIFFFAKPVLWLYFIITDKINSDKLLIVDTSQQSPVLSWQQHSPVSDNNVYEQLCQKYPDKEVVCFVSGQILNCHDASVRQLQLQLKTDVQEADNQILINRLPNPNYQKYTRIDTPTASSPVDANYEIIKTMTNTTPLTKG